MIDKDTFERLAVLEHERWVGWGCTVEMESTE